MMQPLNEIQVPEALLQALRKSWSRESCWVPMQPDWNQGNPALGNCLVSVLAVWAETGFKGKIIPDLAQQFGKGNPDWHFHIELDGQPVDVTRQQFAARTQITPLKETEQMYGVLVRGSFFDAGENQSLRERLQVLLTKMQENGYSPTHSADAIVDRLEQEFQKHKPSPAVKRYS
jgi:hypothetical protein